MVQRAVAFRVSATQPALWRAGNTDDVGAPLDAGLLRRDTDRGVAAALELRRHVDEVDREIERTADVEPLATTVPLNFEGSTGARTMSRVVYAARRSSVTFQRPSEPFDPLRDTNV
jgi:hypothetical protein